VVKVSFCSSVCFLSNLCLRTVVNYQYRFGTNTTETITTLYKEGGIPRFYQGLPFALLQGPLARFGDTASNALMTSIWDSYSLSGINVPLVVQTASGSVLAGTWRLALMPLDSMKTILQVNGKDGWDILKQNLTKSGFEVLYRGCIASSLATVVGHFPWFLTYNYLSVHIPSASILSDELSVFVPADSNWIGMLDLLRSAVIGLCATSLSDTCSNTFRVLKTSRQTSDKNANYLTIAKDIIAVDGWKGLLGRGLQVIILLTIEIFL
jgi:hypothetical protein